MFEPNAKHRKRRTVPPALEQRECRSEIVSESFTALCELSVNHVGRIAERSESIRDFPERINQRFGVSEQR